MRPLRGALLLLAGLACIGGCRPARLPGRDGGQPARGDARPGGEADGSPATEVVRGSLTLGSPARLKGRVEGPFVATPAPVDGGPDPAAAVEGREVPAEVALAEEAAGPAPCERSHAALVALARRAGQPAPPRADYLAACGRLPEPLQRCMVPTYQVANAQACADLAAAADPEALEALHRVVDPGGRPGSEAADPPRRSGP